MAPADPAASTLDPDSALPVISNSSAEFGTREPPNERSIPM